MSVINDVLKELQNRESRFTPLELAGDGVATAPQARRSILGPLALLLLLALLGLAAGWYFQYYRTDISLPPLALPAFDDAEVATVSPTSPTQLAAVTPLAEQEATGLPESITVAAVSPPPNAIIGLQLQEASDELRMEFVLRERAVAYLKQRDENGFAYHLGDIESQIVAPAIVGNRWLEQLVISTTGDGVDIRFVTAPDILVDTSQARGDDQFVWAISLRHSPPASRAETRPAAPAAKLAQQPDDKVAVPSKAVAPPVKTAVEKPDTPRVVAGGESANRPTEAVRLNIRSTGPTPENDAQLQTARKMVEAGRYLDAERLLRELLGGAEDYDARRQLLALYSAQQQFDRIALLASDSAARYPGDSLFVTEHARSLFQGADYVGVIRLLGAERALDARQQSLLAVSYQRLGRHGDAIRHFRIALAEDGAMARNWVGLAISLEQSAAPGEALKSYEQALALGDLNQRLQSFAEQRRSSLRGVLN